MSEVVLSLEGARPDTISSVGVLITAVPGVYFSNAELYTKFDANNRELAYVYDTFEWEHCEAEGYPLQLIDV